MTFLASGVVGFLLAGLAFWRVLPQGGVASAFVGTMWEPWVASAFTVALVMTFAMVMAGAAEMLF